MKLKVTVPPRFVRALLYISNNNGVSVRSPLAAPSNVPVEEDPKTPLRLVYVAPGNADPAVVVMSMELYVLVTAS
jgi:hypothetical protein